MEFFKKAIFIVSLTLNLCLFIALCIPFTDLLSKPLLVDEPLRKSEVIVILSAGFYDDLLDYWTLERIHKGLRLYRDNWAHKIICVGGTRHPVSKKLIAEAMKDTLILYGIPEKDILVQDKTTNTYNDITYLLDKFKNDFDFNNALFVTSAFHTYRVKKILQKEKVQAVVVAANPYEAHSNSWRKKLNLFRSGVIVREYPTIFYFKLRKWI